MKICMRIVKETAKTIYYKFAIASIFILLIFVVYIFLSAVIPFDVVTFDTVLLTVNNPNKEVKSGDFVSLQAKGCKHFALEAEIKTTIIDTLVWQLPNTTSNLETGCFDRELKIKIPTEIPIGEVVRIHRELTYKVSPFSEKTEVINSEFFKIVK